jgi:rhamnogalacturonyl hydrolase YesR
MFSMQRVAWEKGVAAQAFLELGQSDDVVLMAREAIVRQGSDGRLALLGSDEAVTDPGANGEAVLFAGKVTADLAFQEAANRMLDSFLQHAPKTEDGTGHHIVSAPQVCADAMYMAPPFLALAGQPDEAMKQIEGHRKLLWNPQAKLFSHIWDAGKRIWVDESFWGVGNGWAVAGMVGVIKPLPANMLNQRGRLISYVKQVLDGCLAHQRADGLFHNIIESPETFVETNLAQILAYCIYRGIRAGWVKESYNPAADSMFDAARLKVDRFGLVQGVCRSPDFNHPGTTTEGQAFFLLMEVAHRDLQKNTGGRS